MITLTTGLPGAGKSLYTITYVKQYAEKEGRPVYYHGIKDLALPWLPLENGSDWHTCPSGSIIVIDECQTTFRPRANGSQVPVHVSELETHRHKGYDLFLITQHPQLLDTNVRKLIGRHFNVIRAFGFGKAVIHEFQECKDQPTKSKADSIKHLFSYPKESYAYYKSAEIHTVKSRMPAKVWFLLAVPFILALIVYLTIQKLPGKKQDDKTMPSESAQPLVHAPKDPPKNLNYIEAHTPELPSLDFTAPVYKELIKPVRVPYPAACVQSKIQGCKCYTDQGTQLQVERNICQQIVKTGFYIDWEMNKDSEISQRQHTQLGDGGAAPHEDYDFTHAAGMTSRASPNNAPAT